MSLDVFRAVVAGYADRLIDEQILAVQTGYWTSYYSNTKHPKPLKKVTEDILKRSKEAAKRSTGNVPKPEVDVDAFLEKEARFKRRLKAGGKKCQTTRK